MSSTPSPPPARPPGTHKSSPWARSSPSCSRKPTRGSPLSCSSTGTRRRHDAAHARRAQQANNAQMATAQRAAPEKVSDQLERGLNGAGQKTLGGLIDSFGEGSFALIFVMLMAVPALPLPTGGVTHVFEVIVMLLA